MIAKIKSKKHEESKGLLGDNVCDEVGANQRRRNAMVKTVASVIMYCLVLFTWVLIDSLDETAFNVRNIAAKCVYLASLGLLIFELAWCARYQSATETMTSCACILIKPLLIVNGEKTQLVIAMALISLLAIHKITMKAIVKPHASILAALIYVTMNLYFYRTSHREKISTLQFAKAFLGFPSYNYYLHGFLTALNTYSIHLLAVLLIPYMCYNP